MRSTRATEQQLAAEQVRAQGRRDAMVWATALIVFTGTWVAGAVLWARAPSPLLKRVGQGMLAGGLVAGFATWGSRFGPYNDHRSVRAYNAILASVLALVVLGAVFWARGQEIVPLRLPSRIAVIAGGSAVLLMALLQQPFEKYLVGDDYQSAAD